MTPLVSRSCCSEGRRDCKPAGEDDRYLGDTWIWEGAWTVPVRHSGSAAASVRCDAARMTLVDTEPPRCPLSSAEGSRRSSCHRRRPQEPGNSELPHLPRSMNLVRADCQHDTNLVTASVPWIRAT